MYSRNILSNQNGLKHITNTNKIRNTHTSTHLHLITNPNTQPQPINHNSYKNLHSSQQCHQHQFKTRQNSNSQLKLSKMSIVSASSLSGQKSTHHNPPQKPSIKTPNQQHQKINQKHLWADHTFGDNFNQNISHHQNKQIINKKLSKKIPISSSHQLNSLNQIKLNTQNKIKGNPKIKINKTIQNNHNNNNNINNNNNLYLYQEQQINLYKNVKKHNNKQIINSMNNIGFGLCNYKKKNKLNTLTTTATTTNTINQKSTKTKSSTKTKKLHQTISISRQYNSRSISKSHNNSSINSKYSTNKGKVDAQTDKKYNIIEQEQKVVQQLTKNNQNELISLNRSILFEFGNEQQPQNLQKIYNRVKSILKKQKQNQQKWYQQKNIYQSKIKQLQQQISKINKKTNRMCQDNQHHHTNQKNYLLYNSINQNYPNKNSNRNKYIHHVEKLG